MSSPGEVLVIDNDGRDDEGCIGDLIAFEAKLAGLAGIVVWGCHRDSAELREIRLPVFSLGAIASGPQRLDPRGDNALASARIGDALVTSHDVAMCDDDGVLFVGAGALGDVVTAAEQIRDVEQRQAAKMRSGASLREQLSFQNYLERVRQSPSYSFREHLRGLGGAVDE